SRPGREVVQVYASRPDSAVERPAKWLAGFAVVDADPGETVTVGILLPGRAFQHWADGGWTLEAGTLALPAGAAPPAPPPRARAQVPMRLTARQLNRATLARQLLLRREPVGVAEAVRRVVALQAQEAASPYLALWNRIAPFDPAALDAAFAGHEVIKATLMRI